MAKRLGVAEEAWQRLTLAVLVALLTAWHADGLAGQAASSEGAVFLILPVGAHGVSLGRAATAMPGQESAFWNPAGLAGTGASRVVLLRGESAVGTSTGISTLLARPGLGTLGFSYLLWDSGEIEGRDAFNNPVGAESLRNHLAMVSASARLMQGLDAGVSFKFVQFSRTCSGRCTNPSTHARTFAVDAGVQVMPSRALPLRVGAMVAHLGPRFQHENAEQADPLPTRVRFAVAYDVLRELVRMPELEGWLTVEVQDRPADPGNPALFFGSELAAGRDDRLFLRAGYVATDPDQAGGAAVGFGMQVGGFELSVAKSLIVSGLTGESEPFTAALSVLF